MRIKVTRKIADLVDGIDLSRFKTGDIVDLSRRDAAILIAEGWAEAAPPEPSPFVRRQPAKDSARKNTRASAGAVAAPTAASADIGKERRRQSKKKEP